MLRPELPEIAVQTVAEARRTISPCRMATWTYSMLTLQTSPAEPNADRLTCWREGGCW